MAKSEEKGRDCRGRGKKKSPRIAVEKKENRVKNEGKKNVTRKKNGSVEMKTGGSHEGSNDTVQIRSGKKKTDVGAKSCSELGTRWITSETTPEERLQKKTRATRFWAGEKSKRGVRDREGRGEKSFPEKFATW